MVAYSVTLTRTPSAIVAADVERLRAVGFGEAAILDICQVTSYYNYVNRLADGLGVELEDFWTEETMILGRTEFEGLSERRRARPGEGDERGG